jgi:anaerobic selenocysteine-containing dehydrogenase
MELGNRLGQEQHWFGSVEKNLDFILKPMGLTWEEFRRLDYYRVNQKYRKFKDDGFATPTGKIELSSTIMEKWGYDPVPGYRETPESPVSRPDMVQEYPYILITGARSPVFFASEHRMIPWLREIVPDPVVEIHPQVAEKLGITDGQWVIIESPRGKIKQRARLTTAIDPRVVAAQFGWWFPEIKAPEHGWNESNINIITDNDPAGYDVAMGADNLRVLMCRIYPVK